MPAELTDDQLRWLAHELVLQVIDEMFVTDHFSQDRRLLTGAWAWAPDLDQDTLKAYVPKLRKVISALADAINARRDRMIELGKAAPIGVRP